MKKSYIFCLVGILSICNGVFGAQKEDVPQEVTQFKQLYAEAKAKEEEAALASSKNNFEKAKELMDEALEKYGQAIEVKLPKTAPKTGGWFDWMPTIFAPYKTEQANYQKAFEKLQETAENFLKDKKLKEALAIYEYAPDVFETEISNLNTRYFAKKTAYEEAQKEAANLRDQGKYAEASTMLEAVISDPDQIYSVIEDAKKFLATLPTPEKALISALQNLKNGFEQIQKKLSS